MTQYNGRRPGRMRARTAVTLPLLAAVCLGAATPSHAAPRNTIRYIQPVVSRTHVTTYNICLYSTAEFPMRDETITLSIGDKAFINSSYVQGGDLHTIIFTLSQSDYLSLKNGDPIAVFYGQGDASVPAAQWDFGTMSGVPTTAKTAAKPAPASAKPVTKGSNK